MTATDSIQVALTLGQSLIGTPDSFVPNVLNASKSGGQSVADFMKPQISDSLFLESLGKGKAAGGIDYIDSTLGWKDPDGNWHDTGVEVKYAEEGSGKNTLVILHYVTVPKSVWEKLKHDTQIPATAKLHLKARPDFEFGTLSDIAIEDTAFYLRHRGRRNTGAGAAASATPPDGYDIIGTIETTFQYSQQPKWYVTAPVTAAGGIMTMPLGKISFQQFVKPLLKSAVQGCRKLWSKMRNTGTMEEGMILLEEAGTAATVTEEVAEGVKFAIKPKGVVCFGAVLALSALMLIVSKISHYSYHAVQIYNLSKVYDLVWKEPSLTNGIIQMAPVLAEGSDSYEFLVSGARTLAPNPMVAPKVIYGSASFSFVSNSAYHGLGESFGCNLYKIDPSAPATTASDYSGQTAAGFGGWAFNITFSGKNQLTCGFTDTEIQSDYFRNQKKAEKLQLEAVSKKLGLKLTVTYDYLDGKHPNENGQEEYYYQSILTVEDVTA